MDWNGDAIYPEFNDGDLSEVRTKDSDGRWCFFHVCCHCWNAHDVRVEEQDGALKMRWFDCPDKEYAKIHEQMKKDKRPRYFGTKEAHAEIERLREALEKIRKLTDKPLYAIGTQQRDALYAIRAALPDAETRKLLEGNSVDS